MARVEAAKAVNNIWTKTLTSYKKDLPQKDLVVVREIIAPTDIVNHVRNLEAKTHAGKSGAFADRVHAVTGRLTQFSGVIGAITSSNAEASLVWGSLKLLLTIVHQSAEEYGKICQSILAVGDSFPAVELLAETFNHSELVCNHVVAFYESVLTFWRKALKFYKRRRVFNIFRAWHDFESEFGDLDRDMKRHGKNIETSAAAVHMNESRTARLEQTAVNRELIEAKRSAVMLDRHREIVRWLAPVNYEASYFADDLRSAYESRHPGTCTWILDRLEFETWMNSGPNDASTRLLWLTGVPGAGKTVVSSFVINRCSEVSGTKSLKPVLYFFFKLTDSDKSSVLAVTRSLLFQLYSLFPTSLCTDIASLRDESGKDKALSDQRLWDLFVKHAKDLANLTIVLDALDECDGVDVLLRRMLLLLQCCNAKIFVVGRREERIALALEGHPRIVISQEDVEGDIRSYATAEIGKIPRFRGKSVQQRMISGLSSGHDGMFLWAYLMIKELKELGTVRQVDDALRSLPAGLEQMHETIITRLDAALRSAHRQLAIKILMWVVCAVRPLRLVELQEILRFEIREGKTAGHSLIEDDDLLYSEKDIELACGSLVISRNGTLQLIHLSTKEILMKKPSWMLSDDSRFAFYVDAKRENPHMATLCLSYISTQLDGINSLTRPNLETVSRLQLAKENYDSTDFVQKSQFIEYASISWQLHLIEGDLSLEFEDIMCRLQNLLTYELTILWIELCVYLHRDIIWTIEQNCQRTILWADCAIVPAVSSCPKMIESLRTWSNAVLSMLIEYGRVIERYPFEIHYLDLDVLAHACTTGSPVPSASSVATQGTTLRERISENCGVVKHLASVKVEPRRQLQLNVDNPRCNNLLGFLLYDSTREVYFTAESVVLNDTEVLWVQERATGLRLQPVKCPLTISDESCQDSASSRKFYTIKAVLSPDRTYLAILYYTYPGYFVTSIWAVERCFDFQDIRHARPWARRLHCFGTQNSLFMDSCLPLTVGQGSLLYCPTGQVHLEHGIRKQIPSCLVSSAHYSSCSPKRGAILAFAGNGQVIIKFDPKIGLVEEISWLEDNVTPPLPLCMPASQGGHLYLKAISQTARFMVYETLHGHEPSKIASRLFHLFDKQRNLSQLQVDDPVPYETAAFEFSRDEQYLLGIYETGNPDLGKLHFSRWAMSNSSLIPQKETEARIPGFRIGYKNYSTYYLCGENVFVPEEESIIILLSADRVLYELDFQQFDFEKGALATADTDSPYQSHCVEKFFFKHDCRMVGLYVRCSGWSDSACDGEEEQLAALDYNQTHMELKISDLSGNADQVETIELEYSDYVPAYHQHDFSFSPDFSMLQAGPHVFDLLAPGHPCLSFPETSPIKSRHRSFPDVSFSGCNGYLIVIEDQGDVAEDEPATFEVFRISHTAGRIEKIAIKGLSDLIADRFSADFHPWLPLLLLTCATWQKHDSTAGDIKVFEVDLKALKSVEIAIPKHGRLIADETETRTFKAVYSECGSFCFVKYGKQGILILSSIGFEEKQARMRIPMIWHRGTSYNGRIYDVNWRDEPMVTLYQASDRPYRNGLRDSFSYPPGEEEYKIAVAITAFPSHLATATFCLLPGKTGDDLVRVLFLPLKGPPEMKHLRVTLNQILAKLEEAARAAESDVEEYFRIHDDTSDIENSDAESDEVAVPADEDGLESYDTD